MNKLVINVITVFAFFQKVSFQYEMSWKAFFQDDFEMHWRLLLKI